MKFIVHKNIIKDKFSITPKVNDNLPSEKTHAIVIKNTTVNATLDIFKITYHTIWINIAINSGINEDIVKEMPTLMIFTVALYNT